MSLSNDLAAQIARSRHIWAQSTPIAPTMDRLIDTVGCGVAGGRTPLAHNVNSVAIELYSRGVGATSWVDGRPLSGVGAALVNGTAVRVLDLNDTYVSRETIHPSETIPAIMAVGQEAGTDGIRLLEGIHVAYEVLCRWCDAVDLRVSGWDGVSLAPIAVVAGTSWVIGLGDDQAAEAIRIATVRSASLLVTRLGGLSNWKNVAFADAASHALLAIQLAAAGVTGPSGAFDGRGGFLNQVSAVVPNLHGDGRPKILDTIVKQYPVQIFIQGAVALALDIAKRPIPASNIDSVIVRTFRYAVDSAASGREKWHPETRETADHSLPFCVAVALARGSLSVADFEALDDPEVRAVMEKVAVVEDGSASVAFPLEMHTTIELTLRCGRRIIKRQARPRSVGGEAIDRKFLDLTGDGTLLDRLRQIPAMEDISDLTIGGAHHR